MKQDKLEQLYIKIMCEIYANAEPSADFMKLIEKHKGDRTDWFKSYYLDRDKFDEIYDRHTKRLNKHDEMDLGMAVYLGCSPTRESRLTVVKFGMKLTCVKQYKED